MTGQYGSGTPRRAPHCRVQTLKGHSSGVTSVVFSQDSKVECKIEQALFVSNDWIIEGKEKILWLPPDYRVTSIPSSAETLAVLARGACVYNTA
jgi:hypothetical protein